MPPPLSDETRYRLLKLLQANPGMSQRELAREMGVSLGKLNYCLRAFIERGWIKAKRFTSNPHKRQYAYLLTPKGLQEKTRVTSSFLKRKMSEYEELKKEISRLQQEARLVEASDGQGTESSEMSNS